MSRKEFQYWQQEYNRNQWGIHPADRRHAQVCMRLDRLINMQLRNPAIIKSDELFISKFAEEYKKTYSLLYSKINAPWLDTNQNEEELALEGQAVMGQMKTKFGLK